MRDQRKTHIKVGITAVAATLVLVLIFGWAKNYRLYGSQKTISVRFESAAGLEKGDPVTVNGVRKGVVEDIIISGNSAIVKATVDGDVDIREDAQFAVSMLDLMGGKKVEIKPGISSGHINYNSVQQGVFHADIPSVMAMLGSVQNDLVNIIRETQITLSSINKIIGDRDFNDKLRASLNNLTEVSAKLNVLIDENRSSLRQIADNGAKLTKESSDFFEKNKDKLSASLDEADRALKSTNELLANLNRMVAETRNKDNNLGKVLYDENIVKDLKTTLENVQKVTDLIHRQLQGKGMKVEANVDLF